MKAGRMLRRRWTRSSAWLLLAFVGAWVAVETQAAEKAGSGTAAGGAKIDFARDIRPIFNQHCLACHGGVKRAGGISYIVRERALAPAKSGKVPIMPGDPGGIL